jgi:colanic acid biosynthesis glycosyl transferase WcaI
MRICIINEFFYPDSTGGTGNTLSDLARSLADNYGDVKIDVITSTNLYRQTAIKLGLSEIWDGITIHRLASRHPNGLSMRARLIANLQFTLFAFLKLRQLGRYDLVLVATAPPMVAVAASIYKALTHTPFVYIIYDLEPDRSVTLRIMGKNHPFVWLFRALQGYCLRTADRIVALGECMRDYVLGAYTLPGTKVDVIHIGSNEGDVVPGRRESEFRTKHNVSGFVVLYTGNFGRYHNFDTILDAAKILQNTNPDVQFILVGGGAQEAHIKSRIATETIENVRVFEFVPMDEYSDLLATADVSLVTLESGMEKLCLPSKFYKILASGRPVVGLVSPISDVAYVIDSANCGRQVGQGDTQTLIEVLRWFEGNPDEAVRLGDNSRKVFVSRFGTGAIAAQYYKTFQAACYSQSVLSAVDQGQSENVAELDTHEGASRRKPEPVNVESP